MTNKPTSFDPPEKIDRREEVPNGAWDDGCNLTATSTIGIATDQPGLNGDPNGWTLLDQNAQTRIPQTTMVIGGEFDTIGVVADPQNAQGTVTEVGVAVLETLEEGWSSPAIAAPFVLYSLQGGAVDGLVDTSGNSANLTSNGTGTPFVSGTEYVPNGTDNYLSLTTDAYLTSLLRLDTLASNLEQLVFAFTIQGNGTYTTNENIYSWGNLSTTGTMYMFLNSTGKIQLGFRGSDGTTTPTYTFAQFDFLLDTDPQNIVMTLYGTGAGTANALLYVNGQAVSSINDIDLVGDGAGPLGAIAGPYFIAARNNTGPDRFLNGGGSDSTLKDMFICRTGTVDNWKVSKFAVYYWETGDILLAAREAGL